jgi:hypothetical protein
MKHNLKNRKLQNIIIGVERINQLITSIRIHFRFIVPAANVITVHCCHTASHVTLMGYFSLMGVKIV